MLFSPVEILEWRGHPIRAEVKGLEQLEILLPPSFHPPVCSTSRTPLQWFPRDHSYQSVSRHRQDLQGEEEIMTLWGASNSTSAWPQPPIGCSFSFLPQYEYLTTLHVAKQLQQKWLNLTSHVAWGNGAFQRGCACMSQQVEEWFGLSSFISQRKDLIAGFPSKSTFATFASCTRCVQVLRVCA